MRIVASVLEREHEAGGCRQAAQARLREHPEALIAAASSRVPETGRCECGIGRAASNWPAAITDELVEFALGAGQEWALSLTGGPGSGKSALQVAAVVARRAHLPIGPDEVEHGLALVQRLLGRQGQQVVGQGPRASWPAPPPAWATTSLPPPARRPARGYNGRWHCWSRSYRKRASAR
ncbi:MAG: hypothetical protein AB7Y46_20775, partial [Armatimonadota bacterium]